MAEPPVTFASVLRTLRIEARLTQEELADAAAVSPRSVSDLERGVAVTPQRETIRRLADALHLTGPVRAQFEAVARGRGVAAAAGTAQVGGAAAATRTLPRDVASFTGRQQELQELVGVAPDGAGPGGVVSIHAIGGMAGVGKTAFAVHAAHRLADRFPSGQIFLALHGHTPGQQPVDPADALASLLLTLGVPAAQIPPGLDARMALWRDRLVERQLLLILDDAASSEQVRPLLPGTGGSLVLVTSRRRLSALDDAMAVSLDTLPADQAAALLARLAGRPGLSAEDPAVTELTRLCGFLPLAIGMVARQLHHHPAWSAAGRAAELAAAVDRLELMATENVSVAAAFDLSYADLAGDQQRLFRRLGLHPGADIDACAAAALDGTDLGTARRGLEALYDQYLLTEPTQGRYRLHDLIRAYAVALAKQLDPDSDQNQATARLLDYYQHSAALAETLLARQPCTSSALISSMSAAVPALTDSTRALAWARAERANLLACLDYANSTGQHARVVALTSTMATLLRQDGPWVDAITRHFTAVQAARHLGNHADEASALVELGSVQNLTADYPAAARATEEALAIYRDLGNRLGQANALSNLGIVRYKTGDYPAAAQAEEEALAIYRDLGNQLGQANVLSNLGYVRHLTGNNQAAAQAQEEALTIYHELGNWPGQADALANLGNVRREAGDYQGAAQAAEAALSIHRDLGNRLGQANTLINLGVIRQLTGDYPAAAQATEEALAIYRDLGERLGQANALNYHGAVQGLTGDYPAASHAIEEALAIYRDIGTRLGQANALSNLGVVRRLTGDHPGAAQAMDEALAIYRDIGDPGGEVTTLNEKGTLHRTRGDLERAGTYHKEALDLALKTDDSWGEAHALAGLARCALAADRAAETEMGLKQALEIFQRIGAAEATDVAAELDALRTLADPPSDGSSR